MAVLRTFTGTFSPGEIHYWYWWVRYPNNNPDLFLDWLVRAVYPPGHEGHPGHFVELVRLQVQQTADGPLYWLDIKNTGTHTTDYECFASYTQI